MRRSAAVPAGGLPAKKSIVPLKCIASTRHRSRDGVWLEESGRGGCRRNIAVALASYLKAFRSHDTPHPPTPMVNFSINKFFLGGRSIKVVN